MRERPSIPETHRGLLKAMTAVLATNGPSGTPQLTAVAFLYDDSDDLIKISLNDTRQKTRNLRRDPRSTLFLFDPATEYRTLELRARADLVPDTDFSFCARAGARYAMDFRENDRPGETRSTVVLYPTRIVTTDLMA